jgi:hypothetical protein
VRGWETNVLLGTREEERGGGGSVGRESGLQELLDLGDSVMDVLLY